MKKTLQIFTALLIAMTTGCNMNDDHLSGTNSLRESTSEINSSENISSEISSAETSSFENNSSENGITDSSQAIPYDGNYPQHSPLGVGIGTVPGRVVWAYDPDSVEWDGSGYWWETDHFNEAVILKATPHKGIANW